MSSVLIPGYTLQVLNDFVAVGYAIPTLAESDLVTINRGERVEGGPVAVMGPGTGLGECQLMWDSGVPLHTSVHESYAARQDMDSITLDTSSQLIRTSTQVHFQLVVMLLVYY